MDIEQVDWIRDGVINALAYPRPPPRSSARPSRWQPTTC
ncbi:hypothetical protein I552_9815 [Mycobacterium xenopi 3993]|nr:hypothetical protein I552_9815 [Mycobacterium xenopi 3993]